MLTRDLTIQVLKWIALLALLWLFLRWFEWRSVFIPFGRLESSPADAGLKFESVALTAADGVKLDAWYVPKPGAKLTVIFCHGNAGNISHRLEKLSILHDAGVNVFIFDYRGYGCSEGWPSEQGTYNDALAAYDWLRREKSAAPGWVVVQGESLGCAVAVELARQRPIGGLVLESGFASVPEMARAVYPWLPLHLICRIRYDTLSKIGSVKVPLLSLHSREDEIVPFSQAERVFAAAPGPKKLVEIRGDHNNGFATSEKVYRAALADFFRSLGG
jgi:pimeloyl-ACP methyl ester carboxylesterase